MSYEMEEIFTKGNLDQYLKELAKEFRKRNGKYATAEIVLVGGAAILADYDFREMTADIDALIYAPSSIKEAINAVGDKFGLPNGWINSDFKRTVSYSDKINQYSVHYKTFSNVVHFRTMDAQYLIAMKLRAGRQYKHDLSDVLGIMLEHSKRGNPISLEQIRQAVENLYGSWEILPHFSKALFDYIACSTDLAKLYIQTKTFEEKNSAILLSFEQKYPGVTNEKNVDSILQSAIASTGKRTSLKAQIENIEKRQEKSNAPTVIHREDPNL